MKHTQAHRMLAVIVGLAVVLTALSSANAVWGQGPESQQTPTPTYGATRPAQETPAQKLTPPSPTGLSPEADAVLARQAIEDAIQKYLAYWGPRYQTAPVKVTVQGDWAYGVADWSGPARLWEDSLRLLARRLPDGKWQALLPDGDDLYRQWLAEVPESLVSAGQKSQLRSQANAAAALRRPPPALAVPSPVTSTVAGPVKLPSLSSTAGSTSTPTPVLRRIDTLTKSQVLEPPQSGAMSFEYIKFVNNKQGYEINYPATWYIYTSEIPGKYTGLGKVLLSSTPLKPNMNGEYPIQPESGSRVLIAFESNQLASGQSLKDYANDYLISPLFEPADKKIRYGGQDFIEMRGDIGHLLITGRGANVYSIFLPILDF